MIDRKKVLYIAELAKLKLSEEEIERYTDQLEEIVGYIDQINSVQADDVEPTCFVAPDYDTMRDDVELPSLSREDLMANAPSVKKGHFAIPKVIGP